MKAFAASRTGGALFGSCQYMANKNRAKFGAEMTLDALLEAYEYRALRSAVYLNANYSNYQNIKV